MDTLPVRVATPADAELVTAVVADAFHDDPLWSWAMRRDDGSTDHHARLWRVFVDGALRYPGTFIVADGAAVAVLRRLGLTSEEFKVRVGSRALLAEPDLLNRIKADGDAHSVKSLCTHCNKCMPTIYSRTLCVETGAPA